MKGKFLTLGLAGMAIVSCSNHDFDFEQYAAEKHEAKIQQYTQAFINTFGTPAAGHTWGFGVATRGTNMNANMWADDWDCVDNVYPDLTADDLAEIKRLLSPGVETHNTIVLPFENYWVQQVYKGEDKYNYHDRCNNADCDHVLSQTELGSDKMNKLGAYNPGQWLETVEGYEHINNFNNGNNTNTPSADKCGTTHVGTTLMVNMPTTGFDAEHQFAFHNSNDSKGYNNYYIIEYNGYWYVGFDFESHKDVYNHNETADIERDWKFTDWIVRITPAYAKGTTPTEQPKEEGLFQVWCEDLGAEYGVNSNDFDFNDVVISFKKNTSGDTEMWLDAAGATLPIEIYWNNTLLDEVHNAFNVNTKTMVNTGVGEPVGAKRLTTIDGVVTTADLSSKLEIKVQDGETGVWYTLENTGKAPQMIVCEYGLQWSPEFIKINDTFNPSFNNWVGRSNAGKFTGK